jgi:hypothetical protein
MQSQQHATQRCLAVWEDTRPVQFDCQVQAGCVAIDSEQAGAIAEEMLEDCEMGLLHMISRSLAFSAKGATHAAMRLAPFL